MTITSAILGEHCHACLPFFKHLESCPRSFIFEKGELLGIFLEVVWVISSFLPFFLFAVFTIHAFLKKTSRGFFIITNLLIQQIVCGLLKKYFAQARPVGACSTTFGYPSSHSGFAASMATWLILETFFMHRNLHFKTSKFYTLSRNGFIVFAPLIPVSRYFLNYHSLEQILCGLLAGFVCTMVYFLIVKTTLLHGNTHKYHGSLIVKTWKKYKFHDNFAHHANEIDMKLMKAKTN